MGCDIHCYIEYRKKDFRAEHPQWDDFGGRINPGRNYLLFGFMAGVRCEAPHIAPRGMAEHMGYRSRNDAWLFVVEEKDGDSDNCAAADAERWIKSGSSTLEDAEKPLLHNRVSHPDWHSHSWLTADEFELAIAGYLKQSGFQINTPRLPAPSDVGATAIEKTGQPFDEAKWALGGIREYWAILAALRCFEAQGFDARLVFWFDN